MFKTDKIAILMATYNGERYIVEQIESLLTQSYKLWELYIHDDGSKDNTLCIINEYVKKYPEKIHIVNGPRTGGAKYNFLYLMQQVDAPYVMFCDQDDVWLSEKICKTLSSMYEMEKKKGKEIPLLIFSDLKVVDQDLNIIADKMSIYQQLDNRKIKFKDLMIQNVVTGCTVMINRTCVKKAVLFNSIENIIMHDWWCSLVAAYFGCIACIDEPLILYRQHVTNSVGAKPATSFFYIINKIRQGKRIQTELQSTRNQICAFVDTYEIASSDIAYQYCQLDKKNKLRRLYFYKTHDVWKNGLLRNLALIFWG